jgi:hypothetical protein
MLRDWLFIRLLKNSSSARKRSRTERKQLRSLENVALDCFAALAKTGTLAFFSSQLKRPANL